MTEPTPREAVAFLVRSQNRTAALTTLGATPLTRDELQDRADVGRVTLGRILHDFDERGWIERVGDGYVLTDAGEMLADGLDALLATAATTQTLQDVLPYLPTHEMAFDPRHLASADVTLPTNASPQAPTCQAYHSILAADNVRVLMSVIVPEVVNACYEACVAGDQQFEGVFTTGVLETIAADDAMAARLDAMLGLEQVRIFHAGDDFPYIVGLLDDTVAFGVTDAQNLPRAYLEVDDDVVRAWAETTYESYRSTADRVTPSLIEEPEASGLFA